MTTNESTSPALRTHAVRELRHNESDADRLVEDIRNIGYTTLSSGFTAEELQTIREKVDAVYQRQLQEIGGEEALQKISDAYVARCLIGYDEYFVKLAAHPAIVAVLDRLLGPAYTLMSQNGILNDPSGRHYQTTWHRDLNYQHFVSSRPLAVSALFCIDDFTPETGATLVLPASHKVEEFPSSEYVLRHQTAVVAPAGSVIVFDAMVFHRAGDNRSGRMRRAVNHIFTLPLIRQQISIPNMLGGRFNDDPFLRRLLGYEYDTGASVQHWRQARAARTGT